jgi:hypothetical protein
VEPQIGQVAIPDVVSTSRKLAQPFVRQKGASVWAAAARRRSRRMELARPAYVAVAVRDIIECSFFRAFWRASGGVSLGSDPGSWFASTPGLWRVRFR